MTFIDADNVIWNIRGDKNMNYRKNTELSLALGEKKFLQMTGFKDYLAFSNLNEPATKGQIILTKAG